VFERIGVSSNRGVATIIPYIQGRKASQVRGIPLSFIHTGSGRSGTESEDTSQRYLGRGIDSAGAEMQGNKQVPRVLAIGESSLERLRRDG
jgi:hypothetical protein